MEKIEVGYHPIATTNGVAHHKYIVYTNNEGIRLRLDGGGSKNPTGVTALDEYVANLAGFGQLGILQSTVTLVENGGNLAQIMSSQSLEIVIEGGNLEDTFLQLVQFAEEIEARAETYHMFANNSNGLVDEVLKKANLPEVKLDHQLWSPGSDNPITHPENNRIKDNCFLADTQIDMWDGTKKAIQDIRPDDWVLSHDKNNKPVPGRVTRTMENRARFILDFHGVMVTPGHAFYCAEGRFKGQHVPIMDILRDDGAYQKADGTIVRAATNCPVGSLEDQFVWVIAGPSKNGVITVTDKAQLRLGTKSLRVDGVGVSLLDGLMEIHGEIDHHGFTATGENILQSVCHWPLGKKLPRPEDYVLVRSKLTLNDIYAQGEWDAAHPPQMPMPYAGEAGGAFKTNTVLQASLQASGPPNIPLSMRNSPNQPNMTRKQRRAHEAKLRKVGKRARRTPVH